MYSPIRCQFSYGGVGRLSGYITTLVFTVVLITNYIVDIVPHLWLWTLAVVAVVATLLSYMPALTWYYNQFSYRKWPLGHRYLIEFKNIEFIAIGEKLIKVKARGIGAVLKINLLNFSESERAILKKLYLELEQMLKTSHAERAVKAPAVPYAVHAPLHEPANG